MLRLPPAATARPETLLRRALSRERSCATIRIAPTVAEIRGVISAVRQRRPPLSRQRLQRQRAVASGNLAGLRFQRFGDSHDRDAAIRFLTRLKREYPSSSLRSGVDEVLRAASAVAAEDEPPPRSA